MRCNLIQNPIVFHNCFRGEVRRFFYWLKVFYWPQTKRSFKKQFSPKWVKNQAKGSKIHKIRTKWHPTYCGNPSILSTDLLWKSTNSVLGATVGIHFLQIWPPTYCGNPSILSSELLWESTNSVLRATVGIHCIFNTPSLLQCQMLLWFKLSTCKWKWNFVSIDIFTSGDLTK